MIPLYWLSTPRNRTKFTDAAKLLTPSNGHWRKIDEEQNM